MRRILLLAITVIGFNVAAFAQDNAGWYQVTSPKDGNDEYSIKLGSGQRSENKAGENITIAVGRSANKKLGRINLNKWYVTDADCDLEYGNLVILKMDGTLYVEAPFAKGSNNIASEIAETLCIVKYQGEKKATGKGV